MKKDTKDSVKDYWNLRANGFSSAVEEEMATSSHEIWKDCFQKEIGSGKEVLDDGCGPGFFSAILAELHNTVTGIDYSEEMVEKAAERIHALGLSASISRGDAHNLAFPDNSFDAVVSRNVIWNLETPAQAYAEIARVLRPGGTIIINDGNCYLYLYDVRYKAIREENMKKYAAKGGCDGGLHGKHNTDNVDFGIIEKIAYDLPLSRIERPKWDLSVLIDLGFYDISVKIHGDKLPMGFTIIARKRGI